MSETLDISQPIIEHQYAKEWHEYKVRERIMLFLFFGFIPSVILINFLQDSLLGGNETLMAIAMLSWTAAYGIGGWRSATFRCPRCHGKFFERTGIAFFKIVHPFSKQCLHCGLKKWAGE